MKVSTVGSTVGAICGILLWLWPVGGVADGTALPDTATHLLLGPGAYVTPSYPGAASSRGFAIPYIDAQYANRIYSNATDILGVYGFNTPDTQAGAALIYDFTQRLARDDQRFRNLEEIHSTARFKLFASHTMGIITGDANVATDIGGHGQGTLAQANLWVTIPFISKFLASFGPGIAWADERYMNTFFSITPAQAAASPMSQYAARAGVLDLHLNLLATYEISSRWSLGASAYIGRLADEADESPVTLQRGQRTAVAYVAYKVR
jgi:MipA family protein